jgi:SAM-dependent methyltransferase
VSELLERQAFLQRIDALRDLGVSTLQGIAAAVEELSLPADAYLFREGDVGDALFILRSGSARIIVQRSRTGGAAVVSRLVEGNILGESAVLARSARSARVASAMTDVPSVVWRLHRSAFEALASHEPLLRWRIQEIAAARQRHSFTPPGIPEGDAGIRMVGHRDYVGGLWEEIGRLQLDFLVEAGLTPAHCLLDIGCGALRAGVHFIHYLAAGNYLGLDKERTLIELGVEKELGTAARLAKQPEFVVSSRFEFAKFTRQPHFSIAQSLFTHLNVDDALLCLGSLRDFVATGHVCFATFFEGESARNASRSHSLLGFYYSRAEMERFGTRAGWHPTYIGDWKHPRRQMMMRYTAR